MKIGQEYGFLAAEAMKGLHGHGTGYCRQEAEAKEEAR